MEFDLPILQITVKLGEEPAAGDLYSFDKLSERRRSRAVLYNLSENLKKKEKKGFLSSITRVRPSHGLENANQCSFSKTLLMRAIKTQNRSFRH